MMQTFVRNSVLLKFVMHTEPKPKKSCSGSQSMMDLKNQRQLNFTLADEGVTEAQSNGCGQFYILPFTNFGSGE